MSKKFLTGVLMAAMLLAMVLGGCGKSADTAGSGSSSGKTEAQNQSFNPDEEKDAIDFAKFRSDYGAVPKVSGDIKLLSVK